MAYGKSNGHVNYDVTWPGKVKVLQYAYGHNVEKNGDAIEQQLLITRYSAVRQHSWLSWQQLVFLYFLVTFVMDYQSTF